MRVVNKGAALRLQGHVDLEIAPGENEIDMKLLWAAFKSNPECVAAYDAQCEPWSHEFAEPKPGQFTFGDPERGFGRGTLA